MCIIAIKSRGIDLPDEEILQNMWRANKDGAGFMYAKDGVVKIRKGFMTYESFIYELKQLKESCDIRSIPLIMHFRITTHGGTKPENTHPFPITDSIGMLKKLSSTTNIGVAHNGIIDIRPRPDISDTMEYTASQLAPLSRAIPDFYKNADAMKMVSNAIGASRMAFMNGRGDIYTIGNFVEEGGMRYSNRSFETPKSIRYFPYSSWEDSEKLWSDYFAEEKEVPKEKRVMWLDEESGDFVVNKKGHYMVDGEYAIDKDCKVYKYDYMENMIVYMPGYRAYNNEGYALKYDWKSPRALFELVMPEKEG